MGSSTVAPEEGRRGRKRRETRARIIDVAMGLFLERGFHAVTVDEISEKADISKRTFFDYFPNKEDVVEGWHENFSVALVSAIDRRPPEESFPVAIEHAMMEALMATSDARSWAVDRLILATPSLVARQHMHYLAIEESLVQALTARDPSSDRLSARITAMIATGGLRVGVDIWRERNDLTEADLERFTRDMFRALWIEIGRIDSAVNGR